MKIDTKSVEFGMALCLGLSYLVLIVGFIYMNIAESIERRKFLKTSQIKENQKSDKQLLLKHDVSVRSEQLLCYLCKKKQVDIEDDICDECHKFYE